MVTDILKDFRNGDVSLEEAARRIGERRAIETIDTVGRTSIHARLDSERSERTGVPEVVFGEGKTVQQMVDIFQSLRDSKQSEGGAMATRVSAEAFREIANSDPDLAKELKYYSDARICVLESSERINEINTGKIAVVCAGTSPLTDSITHHHHYQQQQQQPTTGTSDVPVFEEAAVSSKLLTRAHVERVMDVGVAGIHRLFSELHRIEDADVVIVCAGMDGALPSVIGGLVSCPVLAVPTSVGYGAAWAGLAPLLTMLNSCAPGVAVMNIDNGFGAAAFAAKLLRRRDT